VNRGTRREDGMATAELAVAMPALLLVLVLALAGVRLGIDQARCLDAARAAARLLARGEPTGTVVAEARSLAPPGARVVTGRSGDLVSVEVRSDAPAVLRWTGAVPAPAATARARSEAVLGGPGP
jgi:hypothetical protein